METLKQYRARKGLTQQQLADLLDVSQPFISHVEKGIRTVSPSEALKWERLTKGELTRFVIRPDLWGDKRRRSAS